MYYFYFKGISKDGNFDSFIGTIEAHESEAQRIFTREYKPQQIEIFELFDPRYIAKY